MLWLSSILTVMGASALPWSSSPGMRSVAVSPKAATQQGFMRLAPEVTGVQFTNELRGDLSLTNAVAHNGSGLAIGDIDGDDWPDLYFCSLQGPNKLFRNLGQWRFEEKPLEAASCADQLSTAAALADVDGDGDLDLLVNGIARGTRLFLNDGRGGWSEKLDAGLSQTASPTSMALADIDGDGDLDLYCTHYVDVMHLADPTTRFALARENAVWRVSRINGESASLPKWKDRFEVLPNGRVRELPELDGFYRNDGKGRFTSIVSEPGIFQGHDGAPAGPFRDWGLAVMFHDLNGDGAPDLYVCNDNASPDRVWLNTGNGTFRAPDPFAFRHTSRSSMGVDVADVNRDGRPDIFVLDMLARSRARRMMQLVRDYPDPVASELAEEVPRYNRNMLFLGQPDGTFIETALMAGVAASDWSWCPVFLDVDLDGYEDLLVTNGFEFDVMDQDSHDQIRTMRLSYEQRKRFRQFHPPWPTANAAFRNRGDGTFEESSEAWGFNTPGASHGMATGDLDNDGDLDVVVNHLNAPAGLYRNEATGGRVAVRLKGLAQNTSGIGARLRLIGGPVAQSQEMMAGGRYLSSDQPLRVFAAGTNKTLELEVTWRNGVRTSLAIQPNTICEVVQPAAGDRPSPGTKPGESAWFVDFSERLQHGHAEDNFDDWLRQPLLPRRLSRLGPGLSWYDANADGWEDLVVPGARGGRLAVLLNQQGQGFQPIESGLPAAGDQGSVVGWADGQGRRKLLVAQSNLNVGADSEATVAVFSLNDLANSSSLPKQTGLAFGAASPGPLALADVDGDGDLDLFVGGRFRPGRYPEPVSSAVWLNELGELRPSPGHGDPFKSIGLVSGATFFDLDNDGGPDLALAMDWGPVRVFRNDRGRFEETTSALGISDKAGWWTGVASGDFDGDGRLDLAAGNWGRNTIEELNRSTTRRLFYGDPDGSGTVEVVEACQEGEAWFPIRTRPWLARGFPDLSQRFTTHEAFGQAAVKDVLGRHSARFQTIDANHFESGVFLNRGSKFEWIPFPREAQCAPVFGLCTGDFDGDGREDLFLSQNFFGSASDLTREDGGRGLWLRGHGDGTFTSADTGVRIWGEQRGAALADFDHDGRVDLAVAQNNGPTRLLRNQRARPGLRVQLMGPPGNPESVGAQLRLLYPGGRGGPVRTVQAGSGYWSQESSVQILGVAESAQSLWIRWPGGKEQNVSLVAKQLEIQVNYQDGNQ